MTATGKPRGNALLVLAICFFASGLVRAGDVVAALPERGGSTDPVSAPADPEATPTPSGPASGAEAGALAAELRRRLDDLLRREAELDERAKTLELVESRLRDRLDELKEAQRKLEQTAELVDDAAGKDVRHLAAMYEQMKPKQAGQIFNQMDPKFAAGFLGQMNASAAALILSSMDAEKAYSVSLLLAGRNVERE